MARCLQASIAGVHWLAVEWFEAGLVQWVQLLLVLLVLLDEHGFDSLGFLAVVGELVGEAPLNWDDLHQTERYCWASHFLIHHHLLAHPLAALSAILAAFFQSAKEECDSHNRQNDLCPSAARSAVVPWLFLLLVLSPWLGRDGRVVSIHNHLIFNGSLVDRHEGRCSSNASQHHRWLNLSVGIHADWLIGLSGLWRTLEMFSAALVAFLVSLVMATAHLSLMSLMVSRHLVSSIMIVFREWFSRPLHIVVTVVLTEHGMSSWCGRWWMNPDGIFHIGMSLGLLRPWKIVPTEHGVLSTLCQDYPQNEQCSYQNFHKIDYKPISLDLLVMGNKQIMQQKELLKQVTPVEQPIVDYATLKLPGVEKEVRLPIIEGTLGPKLIDIKKLYGDTGYLTHDPGFMCTSSCMSTITYIDGEKGQLLYRGYPIEQLAENSTYIETSYLLIYGVLPSKSELAKFEEIVVGEMMVNEKLIDFYKGFKTEAHPMAIMVGVVGALSAFLHSDYDVENPVDRHQLAIKLIAKMPTLAAYTYRTTMGLPIVYPKKNFGYMRNFLYMMFSNPMHQHFQIDPKIERAMEAIFVVHADHEQNASTSTVRIAGSSMANPFACIAAGIGSLWGPRHGGANEAVLTMLEQLHKDRVSIEQVISKSKDKASPFRLMGFGHRVYKNFDPRAKIMQKMCYAVIDAVGETDAKPLLDLAINLEKQALADEYFVSRKLYPNVDFYTGIVYKAIGIPKSMFTVLFAVSRSVGWIAQWCQMMNQGTMRISRPRQMYVGHQHRDYLPIEKREQNGKHYVQQVPKLCKLTGLMKL